MSTVDSASLLIDGPWEHRHVAANGARFHVALAGPDDRDVPLVVLLHGVPQFWWAWRHQLPVLADAGYRVAAMDLRGTGGSDKPPQGYDVPTMAADVAGVIQSLGAADAVIVGSGTGGEIAWATTGLHPDRVRAVGALAAPHPLDTRGHPRTVRAAALRRLAFMQLPSLPERALMSGDLVARLLHEWGGAPGWLDARAEGMYRAAARVPFAAHSQMEQLRWLVRSMPRPDGRRYHAALEDDARPLPVLQVHGGRDGLRPATRAALSKDTAARAASRYQFELLRQVGHFPAEEAPDRVNDLLVTWLAEVAPV
ncbi:alpha/beta hydrolase [uncultured Cellulomonas sp.]|uniref:alpha/beta fold hydrolase n=1 Tax=uncultured Cellulomonas sp. TaxID=189682 RepID=UPI0028E865D5|nr:alpha/beta hydrolase [uncultured Cellulomonas sp.]